MGVEGRGGQEGLAGGLDGGTWGGMGWRGRLGWGLGWLGPRWKAGVEVWGDMPSFPHPDTLNI